MTVRVLFFAAARDLAGVPALDLDLAPGSTVLEARRALQARMPHLAPLLDRSSLAVDETVADDEWRLEPGCTVAVLPPVSGG